ncbi:hypothetical protein [Pseudothioclava arenosa]|uniref:Sulphotransferase Stf0 domain-containing protein n=1 Tax=Pseudothioclava arenosa TaxID=1795308 RepID=A0A2A4CQT7_9RHOB|nr:hypothetical protein [Pseudothioclava arenosa]PCD76454.1 hypothetical protein CLN94_09740 [Pseudothioclava arenosa]
MSYPFLIWTMRRTGGTTLASLVMEMSEHLATEHEPFNVDRKFGAITRDFRQRGDLAALRAGVDEALAPGRKIKHCHEIVPSALNRALMEAGERYGNRHVVLDRRNEVDRIVSLELAKITGAWGKEAADANYQRIERGEITLAPIELEAPLRHLELCRNRRQQLARLFEEFGVDPFVIHFEDVYGDFDAGRARVQDLLAHLAIDRAAFPDYEKRVRDALLTRGQNTARITDFVPNISELRARLEEAVARDPFSF